MMFTKPYFKSTRSTHQRDDISPWDAYAPAYLNSKCTRCDASKKVATPTVWCDDCNALPVCDECGDAKTDCTCGEYEPCDGCEFGCGECDHSQRVSGHHFDRERWGYDG